MVCTKVCGCRIAEIGRLGKRKTCFGQEIVGELSIKCVALLSFVVVVVGELMERFWRANGEKKRSYIDLTLKAKNGSSWP